MMPCRPYLFKLLDQAHFSFPGAETEVVCEFWCIMDFAKLSAEERGRA